MFDFAIKIFRRIFYFLILYPIFCEAITNFGRLKDARNRLWNAVETGFFPSPHNNLLPHNEEIIKNRNSSANSIITYNCHIIRRKFLLIGMQNLEGIV